jgi:RNA polymerase sigma factor (sigma-70 family)
VEQGHTTAAVQQYLNELADGSSGAPPADSVVRSLIARSVARLEMLCGVMLHRSYPRLTQPPVNLEVEDLLNAVVIRLIKAMQSVRPNTTRHFFAMANQHIRWELNDLARRLDKQGYAVELRESLMPSPESPSTPSPGAGMARILNAIEALPEEERETFELIQIQGLTHAEAANVLDVSIKTVQRRVNRGLMLLTRALDDMVPKSDAT